MDPKSAHPKSAHPKPAHPKPALLRSWKEIATFLNCSVRTAQRWERRESMPVERHNHTHRQTVWGNPAELRVWLDARSGGTATVKVNGNAGQLVRVLRDGELLRDPLLLARALFDAQTIRELYRTLGKKQARYTSLALIKGNQKSKSVA